MVHFSVPDMAPPVRFLDVRLASGVRLHYVDQGPEDGPAVLMLHGTSDSSFSFSRVLPLLPSRWRVIAPDQRGHGDSDRPATGYAMDDFALDALELLDALRIRRATVVGHSMGSTIARCVAGMAPARVDRLVLVGAGPSWNNAAIRELASVIDTLTDPIDPGFVRGFQEGTSSPSLPPEFLDRVVAESLKLPAGVWKAVLAGMTQHVPGDDRITVPTLVLGGERDAVFSVSEQQDVARRIRGAELRLFPGIGHALHWEAPELFAAALR